MENLNYREQGQPEIIMVGEELVRADYHAYMVAMADRQEKQEGDGRKTRKPQSENKGKWGKHEPVRDRPKDREKKEKRIRRGW